MATTREVAKLLGVTYRQLSLWSSRGLIDVPSRRQGAWRTSAPIPGSIAAGSGSVRDWGPEHIERATEIRDAYNAAAAILREAGLLVPWEGPKAPRSGWSVRTGDRR